MAIVGFFSLMFCFFSALTLLGFSIYSSIKGEGFEWIEYGEKAIFFFVSISCLILLVALYNRDFSFNYVWEYTDTYLPWYYALSALWAGQEGSLLLWTFFMVSSGVLFIHSRKYSRIPLDVKNTFWIFFFAIEAFFFMLLITVANPFLLRSPAPAQGNGLNPLLMHPGMVFHPPALFMGYAGFMVPSLLVLAERISRGSSMHVSSLIRRWSLGAWLFLSIGIILGAWWSYFELGWGGYWAWDPVENASLIPWLSATAFLHVYIIRRRSGALDKTCGLLASLTLVFCFFATFLTRSGIVESLHAFGKSNLGMPFLFLLLVCLVVVIYVTLFYPSRSTKGVAGISSREGMLLLTAWVFMGLCAVIVIGSLYPLISGVLLGTTKGVGASFYNHIFLPIFCGALLLLILCPWAKWRQGGIGPYAIALICLTLLLGMVLWFKGVRDKILLFGIVSSGVSLVSVFLYLILLRGIKRWYYPMARWAIHGTVALMAISIAISSGYKRSADFIISRGQTIHFCGYSLTYKDFSTLRTRECVHYRATFSLSYKGVPIGSLSPEKRLYLVQNNTFSKVAVLNRPIDEIYLTILDTTPSGVLKLEVQINPMVHWIWIGGILLALFALIAIKGTRYG